MVRNGVCVCICLPPFNFSSHPLLSLSSPPMRSHNSNRGTALMQCEASSIFFFFCSSCHATTSGLRVRQMTWPDIVRGPVSWRPVLAAILPEGTGGGKSWPANLSPQ